MDQNLKDDNFGKSGNNVDVPLRDTSNEGEITKKCNQCDFASVHSSNLRRHLKTHNVEN